MPNYRFQSSERRGVIVLATVLVAVMLVVFFMPKSRLVGTSAPSASSASQAQGQQRYYAQPEHSVETFPFDPNTADSTSLLRLGLTPSMVRGIYKSRAMGYTYSEPADFSHVPGMTNEMWERLRPAIRIAKRFQRVAPAKSTQPQRLTASDTAPRYRRPDSPALTVRPAKLREGETIELNSADTSALKRIPGIGSYYASQIVRYRDRLGGFASLSQLHEVPGLPADASRYLTLDATAITRIDLSHATKNALLRHPYIDLRLAEPLWQYLRGGGKLRSPDDLRQIAVFTDEDIARLAPYLKFQ